MSKIKLKGLVFGGLIGGSVPSATDGFLKRKSGVSSTLQLSETSTCISAKSVITIYGDSTGSFSMYRSFGRFTPKFGKRRGENIMKRLIIFRHGDENYDGTLTRYGETQMRQLSERLQPYIKDQSILVFSSLADRAIASARIIAEALGVSSESTDVLGNTLGQSDDVSNVLRFVRGNQDRADVLVLVSHDPTVGRFPDYYLQKEFDYVKMRSSRPQQGQAVLIDLAAKSHQVI